MNRQIAAVVLCCFCLARPGLGTASDATPSKPDPASSASGLPPTTIQQSLSDACYAESLAPSGDPASCDALIAQAESEPVAPARLAAAYSNRGLIISRRARGADATRSLEAALRDCEAASRLAPERVEPMINQANVLMRLGRFAEALALYNSVIALPGTANSGHGRLALFNRALAYRALGELELAHADLAQAGAADIGGTGTVEAIPSGGLLPISPQ